MGLVSIDIVEPGMILGSEVRDGSGRVLLGGGAEVSEKHMTLFRRWGVMEVDIEGMGDEPPDEEAPLDPEVLEEARRIQKERFQLNDLTHPFIGVLFELSSEREARRLTRERS